MKLLIWICWAVLLSMWTVAAWAAAEAIDFAGRWLGTGGTVDWAALAGRIDIPAWLTWFVDPAWLARSMELFVALLERVQLALPGAGAVLGWLTPAVWTLWAFGTLTLLALAVGLHRLVSRSARPAQLPAGA